MLLKTISIIYKTVRLGINEFQSRLGHPLIPNYFQPSLVPSFANIPNNISERGENDLISLLNEYILKAVPKSKVSLHRIRIFIVCFYDLIILKIYISSIENIYDDINCNDYCCYCHSHTNIIGISFKKTSETWAIYSRKNKLVCLSTMW